MAYQLMSYQLYVKRERRRNQPYPECGDNNRDFCRVVEKGMRALAVPWRLLAVLFQPSLHLRNLLFLRGDDVRRQLAQFGVGSVLELNLGHVDRP
jgi:hypothetical protein